MGGSQASLALNMIKNTARPKPIILKIHNFIETCQIAFKITENIGQGSPHLHSKNHWNRLKSKDFRNIHIVYFSPSPSSSSSSSSSSSPPSQLLNLATFETKARMHYYFCTHNTHTHTHIDRHCSLNRAEDPLLSNHLEYSGMFATVTQAIATRPRPHLKWTYCWTIWNVPECSLP